MVTQVIEPEPEPPVYDPALPTLFLRHEAQVTDIEEKAQRCADNTGQVQQILEPAKPGMVGSFLYLEDMSWHCRTHVHPNPRRQGAGR